MSASRLSIACLLAVLLVVSGCLGGPTTAESGPPNASWTDGETLDTDALVANHFETLRERGSFTVNRSEAVRVEGDARPPQDRRPEGYYPPSVTRRQVNLATNRLVRVSRVPGHRRSERFLTTEVDASRRKSCPSDDCAYEYRFQRRSPDASVPRPIARYRDSGVEEAFDVMVGNATLTYVDTVERDGQTLYRYRGTRNLSHPAPPFSEPPTGTVTVLVTDDGVIRRFVLRYAGTGTIESDGESRTVNVTQTFVATYTAVGETTVERPGWVARARSRDPPPSTATAASRTAPGRAILGGSSRT